MKNSSDTIRNRTRDLPVYNAVPQPTTPPCAPKIYITILKYPMSVVFLHYIMKTWIALRTTRNM